MDMDQCRRCQSTGLALMPVRYAIVPPKLDASVPGVLQCDRVTGIPLDTENAKYALRVLRQGFYYVFYEEGPDGKNYWESYSVDPKGHLWHMPFPEMVRVMDKEGSCRRKFHLPMVTQFITIRSPEKCGTVWFAFSGHKWSPETIEYYEKAENRKNRFQSFKPADWINGNEQQKHAVRVYDVLSEVVEYKDNADPSLLPSNQNASTFSSVKPAINEGDGRKFVYSQDLLEMVSTRYPLVTRRAKRQIANTFDVMQSRSTDSLGMRHFTPVLFAMWDAVGCAHELNDYRNEPAGRLQQFAQEREFELGALAGIDGAKLNLKQQAALEAANDARIIERKWRMVYEREKKAGRWNGVNHTVTVAFSDYDNPESMNDEFLEIETFPDDWRKRQENAAKKAEAEFENDDWPDYQEYLDVPSVESLRSTNKELSSRVDALVDSRTVNLIKWLEAPLLVDTLRDFNESSIADGVLFEDTVSNAIFGIGSTPTGSKKLDEWIAEAKATVDTNLLWRVVALNQKDAKVAVDDALQQALAAPTLLTEAAWELFLANTKTIQRFADVHKRSEGIKVLNRAATGEGGLQAFGVPVRPVNAFGLDKFVISVGDAVFRAFRVDKAADYLAEKIIQHLFLIRAGVDPIDSARLVGVQARNQKLANADILQRIYTAKTFLDIEPSRSQQAASLAEAWEAIKKDESKGPQAVRDVRLALIVGLVESGNLLKLLNSEDQSVKTKAYILTSCLTITAAVVEIAIVPAWNIWGMDSATHQKLRFVGGALGGVSSLIGGVISATDFVDSLKKDRYGSALLLAIKTLSLLSVGVIAVVSATTYSAGLLAKLAGKSALAQGVRVVGSGAIGLIGGRIIAALSGWLFTVGLIALDILIQIITPNAMEEWLDACALGQHPDDDWDTEQQQKAFDEAIAEVL